MYSSTNPRFDQSITLKPILSSIPQQTPELTIPQSQRQTEPSQTPPTEERNPEITIESQSVEKEEEEAKIDDFISGSETKVPQNHEKDGFLPFLLNDQKSQRVEIFMMDNSLVIQPKMSQQPAETTMAAKCELISNVSEEANGGRDISGETGSNGYCRKRYRRSDMEALKFVNVEEQRKMWNEIYIGLEPAVSREFDNLSAEKSSIGKPQKPKSRRRSAMGLKKDKNLILSEVCNQDMHINFGEPDIVEACPQKMKDGLQVVVHDCNDELAIDVECHQNDDSDGEINSIQRPAFFVDGDPDFESGPPQDGLEYLRRVRYSSKSHFSLFLASLLYVTEESLLSYTYLALV
ncbi:hypothetical protein GIB67_036659 [Kingdonia uniflora]|uniref:Uncharacterized protein n=1 Tax=Kingdonia uniflora TaxID=39325 RepID=A0A7J7LWN1_9MAGN|nr:hypothetical protein GIB67_036659 [Kingdonia uniflora]